VCAKRLACAHAYAHGCARAWLWGQARA